jgi:hypothetical protein
MREAAADSPAPSGNGPTHVPSNVTDVLTYASSSLVEDGGTTAPLASLSVAGTVAPMATSTAVADALLLPTTMPTATLTTTFCLTKLNLQ